MSRISRGSWSRKKKVLGADLVPLGDGVFRCGIFRLRSLVERDVLVDALICEDDFICCRILELRRMAGTSVVVARAIIESW